MKFPRLGSAPFGFGGPGAPPGFGSSGSGPTGSNAGDPLRPPQRAGVRRPVLVNRDPSLDSRVREAIDLLQEFFNSLSRRGFISRDAQLRWSLAPNPYVDVRDPTATDDVTAGVLVGEVWINQATATVWINLSNQPGAAVWLEISPPIGTGSFTYTETF